MAAQNQSLASAQNDPFSLVGDPLVEAVTAAVRMHMSRYDGSHDFAHIRRVVGRARHLTYALKKDDPNAFAAVDQRVIALAALLHDVGDRKYLPPPGSADDSSSDAAAATILGGTPYADDLGARATAAVLHRCGGDATPALADLSRRVITVCQNVSWSGETRTDETRAAVAALAQRVPELAIVQDADRLDSLGAVGVARCFAFGGRSTAKSPMGRPLALSLDHFDEKLVLVGGRMKTTEGRRLAEELTQRLQTFQAWFREEAAFAIGEDQAGSA